MSSPSMKLHRFPHRTIYSYRGSTPQLDGVLAPGEWTDAYRFSTADAAQGVRARTTGPNLWTAQFSEVVDATDSALQGYTKYDGDHLFFGFEVCCSRHGHQPWPTPPDHDAARPGD